MSRPQACPGPAARGCAGRRHGWHRRGRTGAGAGGSTCCVAGGHRPLQTTRCGSAQPAPPPTQPACIVIALPCLRSPAPCPRLFCRPCMSLPSLSPSAPRRPRGRPSPVSFFRTSHHHHHHHHLAGRPLEIPRNPNPSTRPPAPAPRRRMSVAAYFASTQRKLRTPGLPCANVGSRQRAVYIPLELCT